MEHYRQTKAEHNFLKRGGLTVKKSLVIGAVFVDVVMNVPRLPISGEDITSKSQTYVIGGSAFNVYGAIKYVDAAGDLFAPIGRGQYADMIRAELTKRQIPVKLPVDTGDNGWDISLVEPNGERTFLTVQGVEQNWKSDWFNRINIFDYDFFYISGYELEDETVADIIMDWLDGRKENSRILFDMSPRIPYLTNKTIDRLLSSGVLVHGNFEELSVLMPLGAGIEEKASRLYRKTKSPVIITCGNKGSFYFDGHKLTKFPSETSEVLNTLGAGDSHSGGILAGLSKNMDLGDAVKLGNQLAELVITKEEGSLTRLKL